MLKTLKKKIQWSALRKQQMHFKQKAAFIIIIIVWKSFMGKKKIKCTNYPTFIPWHPDSYVSPDKNIQEDGTLQMALHNAFT